MHFFNECDTGGILTHTNLEESVHCLSATHAVLVVADLLFGKKEVYLSWWIHHYSHTCGDPDEVINNYFSSVSLYLFDVHIPRRHKSRVNFFKGLDCS